MKLQEKQTIIYCYLRGRDWWKKHP